MMEMVPWRRELRCISDGAYSGVALTVELNNCFARRYLSYEELEVAALDLRGYWFDRLTQMVWHAVTGQTT